MRRKERERKKWIERKGEKTTERRDIERKDTKCSILFGPTRRNGYEQVGQREISPSS